MELYFKGFNMNQKQKTFLISIPIIYLILMNIFIFLTYGLKMVLIFDGVGLSGVVLWFILYFIYNVLGR
jgi:hypothetical protein